VSALLWSLEWHPYHYICDINPVLFPAEYNQQNHTLATNVAKDGSFRNSGTISLSSFSLITVSALHLGLVFMFFTVCQLMNATIWLKMVTTIIFRTCLDPMN
jgi:hypothetical protein